MRFITDPVPDCGERKMQMPREANFHIVSIVRLTLLLYLMTEIFTGVLDIFYLNMVCKWENGFNLPCVQNIKAEQSRTERKGLLRSMCLDVLSPNQCSFYPTMWLKRNRH